MPIGDVVLLITAVSGVAGTVGLIFTPIIVAKIESRSAVKRERIEQGQPVDHLGALIADLQEARDFQRKRADREAELRHKAEHRQHEAERRLTAANRELAAADLPTH